MGSPNLLLLHTEAGVAGLDRRDSTILLADHQHTKTPKKNAVGPTPVVPAKIDRRDGCRY